MEKQELSYEAILARGWGEIPKPQFLPDGSYRFRCTGGKAHAPKTPDGSTRVVLGFEPQEAMEDVDSVALAALGDNYDISENVIWVTVWLQKATDYAKLRNIMEKCGLNLDDYQGKDGFDNSLKAMKGMECHGYVITGTEKSPSGEMVPANKIITYADVN